MAPSEKDVRSGPLAFNMITEIPAEMEKETMNGTWRPQAVT